MTAMTNEPLVAAVPGYRPHVSVIVPTFNERDNIRPLLARLGPALPPDSEVIIVDDSVDDTVAIIEAAALDVGFPVRVHHRAVPTGGLGGAVVEGLRLARGTWAVVMDADLQHPPELVTELVATGHRDRADLVVASRYARGGTTDGLANGYRQAVSRASTWSAKLAFPLRLRGVTDPMSGFFAVRTSTVDVEELRPYGYKVLLELIVRTRPGRTVDVPFAFGERFAGASKSSVREGLRYLRHLATLRLTARSEGRSPGLPQRRSHDDLPPRAAAGSARWRRWIRTAWLAAAVLMIGVLLPLPRAFADANLVVNGGFEAVQNGFPLCWERSGYGDNGFTFALTNQAHTGTSAMSLSLSSIQNGDRKAMMLENVSCAPVVTPGHQYDLSVWYTTNTPNTVVTSFRHDVALGWQYWTDMAHLTQTQTFTRKTVRTPPVPPGTDQITWGVTIYGVGTLVTDDYSMVDVTLPTPGDQCSAGDACTKGVWQEMPFDAPARAMHAVLLRNGNVLLIAGSGNDEGAFNAGTFKTALYQPYTGTFINIPTPNDLFCSGHVQLADGRVLVMGGNKSYPTADLSVGYGGLKTSYIFDPTTNSYTQINDTIAGHWYPSATMLGNGDVISLGGLAEDSNGTVISEYYDASEQRWLSFPETKQTWSFWGLYPAMILMQDGRLFYTGSHVFGRNLDGTGASLYNYDKGTIVDVPGLQRKDERDQSMSVLLPPAQDQRVLTVGGSLPEINPDAIRTTDLIDLKQANPHYVAGPLLPTGMLNGGVAQTATQGKKYVSLVILPDGKVFETGGGMHTRATPVYESSMFDPATNTWIPGMAPNPTPHTYHSVAVLLPDARVMLMGNNPADGSYDTSISIYSPPYLFRGARPQIQAVANTEWTYGSTQQITVDTPVVKASLIRPAAVTHSSDPNQRYVELPLSVDGNSIGLNVTSNPNLAPPGYYMLFVVGANGVPSVARWVHLT